MPFVPSGSWSPCAPLIWNEGSATPPGGSSISSKSVKVSDIRFLSSEFRKQHSLTRECNEIPSNSLLRDAVHQSVLSAVRGMRAIITFRLSTPWKGSCGEDQDTDPFLLTKNVTLQRNTDIRTYYNVGVYLGRNAVLVLPILAFTSASEPRCSSIMLPRYVKDFTSSRVSPSKPAKTLDNINNSNNNNNNNNNNSNKSGKFGEVKRCQEKKTGREFAAKFVPIASEEDMNSVLNEIAVMNKLRHPRLIQLYDAYQIDEEVTLVLELITGGELFERIIDESFNLNESRCIKFMHEILQGVEYMHSQNVIHLDLKVNSTFISCVM
ncbi:unnamed protein product [Schistosoma curassoni]|uniref:Protein kinase domain-containing protein n=1 Tax=Schistosoma curassoni TaxID=6186 RepID=A0A183K153_9TREM|nr:unnamed protein product [Schistosoma curassoni]